MRGREGEKRETERDGDRSSERQREERDRDISSEGRQ